MININKRENGPVNLKTKYLKALEGQNPKYDCAKVRELLKSDFKNKCYLCESKQNDSFPFVGGNERIEHFLPHFNGANLERKYSWSNLFLSCEYCNGVKGQIEELINCTSKNTIVTQILNFKFIHGTLKPEVEINIPFRNDNKAINTKNLLNKIYNKPNQTLQLEIANRLRNSAKENFDSFIRKLEDYIDNQENINKKNKIKEELSLDKPYLAFKVCFIKSSPKLMSLVGDLIPTGF
ncbi:MAG: hypothetical protein KAT68_11890 [Bacteroidales bacterium]|nr:hypothetical protein [Bacteroidales bacterium]